MLQYIPNEELHEVLVKVHARIAHGKRDKMLYELKLSYKNIGKEVVEIFLPLCPTCLGKKKVKRRGLTVKPLVFHQLNDRMQIDLIDFQSNPDGEYKWIMNVQDHIKKFIHLRPMKTKTMHEVASKLLKIMLVFGALSVLQSDNGREFCNHISESLKVLYPAMKIVHGRPRHSQCQGSVERANQDVQDCLTAWMISKTNKWSEGLKFVASQKMPCYTGGLAARLMKQFLEHQ